MRPVDDDPPAPNAPTAIVHQVVRAQFGDLEALDGLLRGVQAPLFRHLLFLLGHEAAAEDALQETLLTVSRKLGTLREPKWFRPWAFRIATRLAVRQARRARLGPAIVALDDTSELPTEVPDEAPFDEVQVDQLRQVLAQVPPASQLVLRMHYEHGLTQSEIAEVLDVSIGTVKSRHHYGLQWLRRQLAVPGQRRPV